MQEAGTCPRCGALGGSCEEVFHKILAMEYDSPRLLAEHFKTVACYNIQHPSIYTSEVIEGLCASLRAHLEEGVEVAEIRRRNSRLYEGDRRVRRQPAEVTVELHRWPMTIRDVWIEGDGDAAAQKVVEWAQSIVEHCRSAQ